MEFWGVEVKPGETVKVDPGEERYVHISQASLGETKKGNESVPVFLKFNNQKLVIGTLSAEKCTQIPYDLVLEKEFELSHSSKNTSIYFCGYKTDAADEGDDDFDCLDDSESDEDLELAQKVNGTIDNKDGQAKPTSEKPEARKPDVTAAKAKPKAVEPKKDVKQKVQVENEEDESDEDDDDDDDMSDEDDEDSDEEMDDAGDDSEDEDSDDDEATPKKVEPAKKRPASASKTPVPEKKAKVVSPKSGQKSGDAGKKGVHIATPHPAKQVGKDKSKQQSPRSIGSVTCKSCSKIFATDNALQAHSKAKHGEGK